MLATPVIGKSLLSELGSAFDCTVQTIADRNAVPKKDGTTVTVIDATEDPLIQEGGAIYRWNSYKATWILLQKDIVNSISFNTFFGSIQDGKIELPHQPLNGQLWDIIIFDSSNKVVSLQDLSNIDITGNIVSGLDNFNGLNIRFSYGYGESDLLNGSISLFHIATTEAITKMALEHLKLFYEVEGLKG
jgi:hypothetical protein